MAIIDILNENRLATTSTVLGMLAIVYFFLLYGTFDAFLYLGIPAIVIGMVCLMRLEKLRNQWRPASVVLPLIGIILGILPIVFLVMGIY